MNGEHRYAGSEDNRSETYTINGKGLELDEFHDPEYLEVEWKWARVHDLTQN